MKFYKPSVDEYKIAKGKYIPTGLPTIDNAINDLEPATLTILSGRSNEGKTTIIKQIIANAIDEGFNVCVLNAEEEKQVFENDIWRNVVGNNPEYYKTIKVNKKYVRVPNDDARKILKSWIGDKLTIGIKDELVTLNELFKQIETQLETGKHDLLIIDNLMALLDTTQAERNMSQANFVEKCKQLCHKTGIHIILVAHPSKEYRRGIDPVMENISGASEIYAKADVILFVTKIEDGDDFINGIHGKVFILKCRHYSTRDICNLHYDKETATLCEIIGETQKRYKYKLDNHITIDETIQSPFDL